MPSVFVDIRSSNLILMFGVGGKGYSEKQEREKASLAM